MGIQGWISEVVLRVPFLFRRRQKKRARTIRIISAAPPAMPPAMAAMLIDLDLDDFVDSRAVGCGNVDESGTSVQCKLKNHVKSQKKEKLGVRSLAIVKASLASHRSCTVTFSYAHAGIVTEGGMESGKLENHSFIETRLFARNNEILTTQRIHHPVCNSSSKLTI